MRRPQAVSTDSRSRPERRGARSAGSVLSAAYSVYQPADFTQIDAYAGYRIATSLLIEVRGYNLGNDRYALYAGYPMPGRSVQSRVAKPVRAIALAVLPLVAAVLSLLVGGTSLSPAAVASALLIPTQPAC